MSASSGFASSSCVDLQRFQCHTALGTRTRSILNDFGMHRAGVLAGPAGRRRRLRIQILLGIGLKLSQARWRAEIVLLTLVFERPGRFFPGDRHAANRIAILLFRQYLKWAFRFLHGLSRLSSVWGNNQMPSNSRRDFLQTLGVLSASALAAHADPLGLPIGCQTYPVRSMIGRDFPGTIKTLAKAGFQNIELCSPVGYAGSGFESIAHYKGSELRTLLNGLGVQCISSHFSSGRTAKGSAGPDRMGKRRRSHADDGPESRRPETSDDG